MNNTIRLHVRNNAWLWGIDPVATGKQLKKQRLAHHFTQEDLSELLECCDRTASRVYIWRIESGQAIPSAQLLMFLSRLYDCPIDELVVSYEPREADDRDQPVPLINTSVSKRTLAFAGVLFFAMLTEG